MTKWTFLKHFKMKIGLRLFPSSCLPNSNADGKNFFRKVIMATSWNWICKKPRKNEEVPKKIQDFKPTAQVQWLKIRVREEEGLTRSWWDSDLIKQEISVIPNWVPYSGNHFKYFIQNPDFCPYMNMIGQKTLQACKSAAWFCGGCQQSPSPQEQQLRVTHRSRAGTSPKGTSHTHKGEASLVAAAEHGNI